MAGNENRRDRTKNNEGQNKKMDNFTVRCVKVYGHSETQTIMNEAYKCLQDESLSPEWFTEKACFDIQHGSRNNIYIFDIFEGEAFEHIVNIGCRVLGPMCIVTSLRCNKDIPKRSKPVYNLAMKDIIVCCTGLQEREPIYNKVERMGGVTSRTFSEEVTHLVAGEVGSKKYLVAAGCGKQIMLPDWVTDVWDKSKLEAVHGLDEQFQHHKCPIFLGRVITVSGLSMDEKQMAKRLIEKEGGKYSGEMKVKECTHLIINEPKGQKYLFAQKWDIAIVKSEWLYESIEKGYCLDEADFALEGTSDDKKGRMKTSTPERRSVANQIADISNISMISMVNVNETVASNMTNMTNVTNMTATMTRLDDPGDPTDNLNVTKKPADLFLDGCKIYLSGFRGTTLEKLRKIINIGGGTRFNQISDNLTHVVIGDKIPRDVDQIKALTNRPHSIKAAWLVDCYKQEILLDETNYTSSELPPQQPTTPNVKGVRRKSRLTKDMGRVSISKEPDNQPPAPAKQEQGEEMDDIMSQYMDQPADATRSNDTTMAPPDGDETVAPPGVDEDMTQDPAQTTVEGEEGIFSGKSFLLYGFEEEHIPQLSSFIKENGGAVLQINTRRIPDYAIVPIVGYPIDRTVKDIVTNAWLQMCIEQNELLDVYSNPLYSPIEIQTDTTPLQDCVLSVSGYVGTERDFYMNIASAIGAVTQDYFVRNAKNGLIPSTHLIVNAPEGSKYTAAKKWGIPALSCRWLLACAKSGKREPEDKYLIDNMDMTDVTADQSNLRIPNEANQSKIMIPNEDNQSKLPENDKAIAQNKNGAMNVDTNETNKISAQTKNNISSSARRSSDRSVMDRNPDFSATGDTEALLLQLNTQGEQETICDYNDVEMGENDKQETTITKPVTDNISFDNRIPKHSTINLKTDTQVKQSETTYEKKSVLRNVYKADEKIDPQKCETPPLKRCIRNMEQRGAQDHWSPCMSMMERYKANVIQNEHHTGEGETPPLTRLIRKLEKHPPEQGDPTQAKSMYERFAEMPPIHPDYKTVDRMREDKPPPKTTETSPSQKENQIAGSTPLQNRVKDLKKPEVRMADRDTPSKFLNPNVRYNPNFDVEDLLKEFDTPEAVRAVRKKHKRKDSLPLDELFEQKFAEAEQNLRLAKEKKLQEQELAQSQEDMDDGEDYSEPSSVLQGVIIAVAKKLVKDQSEINDIVASLGGDYRWNYDTDCTHFIFQGRQNDTAKEYKMAKSQGLKIVSPHWLYMCKEQNARVDEHLFPHTFNPNLSLSVVSSRRTPIRTPRSTRRNMRDRLNSKPEDMAPPPIDLILTKGEESTVKGLAHTAPGTPKGVTVVKVATPKVDKNINNILQSPGRSSSEEEKRVPDVDAVEVVGSLEMREELSRQLENVMAESKGKKRRKSKRLNCSGQAGTPEDVSSSSSRQTRRTQENVPKNTSTRNSRSLSEADKLDERQSGDMQASQSVHVVWDDPMGRMEQEKLAHKLDRANSPTQEVGGMYDDPEDAQYSETEEDNEEVPIPQFQHHQQKPELSTTPKLVKQKSDKTPTPEGPSIAFPVNSKMLKVTPPKPVVTEDEHCDEERTKTPPVFILSGMTQPEKDDYGALIEQLGGRLLDAQQFDVSCTHLVISNVTRNEKFLASIAAGKWVLHKSYFEACRSEGTFVEEEFYEWGSEGTLSLVKNMESNVRLLAIVARDWRIKIQKDRTSNSGPIGAFCTWRVILCCDKKREGNYKRLLEAGGATVLNDKPPFTSTVDATHVLLELHRVELSQGDLETLVTSGCLCLRPEYISSFLSNPNVAVASFCPQEIDVLKTAMSVSNENTRKRRKASSTSSSDLSLKRTKRK